MLEALEGVDGWEWDVFRLRQASAGRELQVSLPPRARRHRRRRRTPAQPLRNTNQGTQKQPDSAESPGAEENPEALFREDFSSGAWK